MIDFFVLVGIIYAGLERTVKFIVFYNPLALFCQLIFCHP